MDRDFYIFKLLTFAPMEALKKNHKKIFKLKQAKKVVIVLVYIMFFEFFLFPTPSLASGIAIGSSGEQNKDITLTNISDNNQTEIEIELKGKLPVSGQADIRWSNHVVLTAYNSEPGQTDDSPCITANGFNVCENGVEDTIAANFLPFGAKVKIPELFGDRVFTVRDRMNKRFSNRVDVWMLEKQDARQFGVKHAKIQVLE